MTTVIAACPTHSSSFGAGTHVTAGPLPVDFCNDMSGHPFKVMDVASHGFSWLPEIQKITMKVKLRRCQPNEVMGQVARKNR